MRVCATLSPRGRDLRLDLFRGLANWAIFLDHIPHEVMSSITTKNHGFNDAADLFGNLLPHWILEPFDPNDKTNLAPYRVVHLIAIAVVVTWFLPADAPILKWRLLAPPIKCGRNSLEVFCVGIVLGFVPTLPSRRA